MGDRVFERTAEGILFLFFIFVFGIGCFVIDILEHHSRQKSIESHYKKAKRRMDWNLGLGGNELDINIDSSDHA